MILNVMKLLRQRTAGVAIIVALSTPLLIGFVALAVDVGYWYQQQETLQSAADAAAVSAAQAEINYSDYIASEIKAGSTTASASSLTTSYALPFALSAANSASNSEFLLTTSTLTLTAGGSTSDFDATSGVIPWTATATIPRASFFSRVSGMGVAGVLPGSQSASATVEIIQQPWPLCALVNGVISVTGGAKFVAQNCGIYENTVSSTAACNTTNTMSTSGSGEIEGQTVATTANCVIPNANGGNGKIQTLGGQGASTSQAASADPLAGMNTSDTSTTSFLPWAPSPSLPGWAGGTVNTLQPLPTNTPAYLIACALQYTNAVCDVQPGNYNTINASNNTKTLVLNDNTTTGRTYVQGAVTTNGTGVTMNGMEYYMTGDASFAGGTLSIGSGAASIVSAIFTDSVQITTASASFNSGFYEFTTGASSQQNTTANGCSDSSCSKGALNIGSGSATLGGLTGQPNTYFFDGGLTLSSSSGSIIFLNPGIYYIRNGNFIVTSGVSVIGVGVTIVLEGSGSTGASFQVGGSSSLNLSAPTSNCVSPSSFPEPTYDGIWPTNAPYDGTNGEGICGIAIYQDRADTAGDTIDEGTATSFTGGIYAPNATLTIQGTGALNISAPAGTPGLEVKSVSDSGSGNITLKAKTSTGSDFVPANIPMLVQ
jgi:Flp pilus assembly protein TadG